MTTVEELERVVVERDVAIKKVEAERDILKIRVAQLEHLWESSNACYQEAQKYIQSLLSEVERYKGIIDK